MANLSPDPRCVPRWQRLPIASWNSFGQQANSASTIAGKALAVDKQNSQVESTHSVLVNPDRDLTEFVLG